MVKLYQGQSCRLSSPPILCFLTNVCKKSSLLSVSLEVLVVAPRTKRVLHTQPPILLSNHNRLPFFVFEAKHHALQHHVPFLVISPRKVGLFGERSPWLCVNKSIDFALQRGHDLIPPLSQGNGHIVVCGSVVCGSIILP